MKTNIALLMILLSLVGVAVAGDGKVFSVGSTSVYFRVNSDGTAESSGGIAATSLSAAVQTSLGKADTALQPAGNLTGSMGASTTAVATVVSGAAAGATAVQPNGTNLLTEGYFDVVGTTLVFKASGVTNVIDADITTP